jgi:hypothetical protein
MSPHRQIRFEFIKAKSRAREQTYAAALGTNDPSAQRCFALRANSLFVENIFPVKTYGIPCSVA